ncbi:PepSY-associated TM helix domain-containing protein [Pseudomonas sp. 148P]|uniref:PepSY-associated TM helix domain-containing protein n=1 Tax=Pseudomonas ulcerans TaxID=3115852 RepID=A0ABU7HN86_9PSED|nr:MULTISPECIES: PepSY-associated TM helix domain-containing protein [unclassified Pseudomonas]MEE1922519.1 PepSY-associated TM helix domain-containing protein [Pseudomonas sp. 147P]MEE1932993.1 PepSY-associated TM helix domain-containing protein [Pseudomonas sp. 148P]
MKHRTITQSLSWMHTWSGLVFGWVLFAIFLTGTLAVFDKEIDAWMRPEIPAHSVSQAEAAQRALDYLQSNHAGASAWNIGLPGERSPTLSVSAGEQRRGGGVALDPITGEPLEVRETAGGSFFFRFHFTLNLPRNFGIWVVGLAAMAMLAALVSGIVIHKKFFKEFFTFRPAKGQRSWLDAHNATAVLVLPFHLMITYTGLVIFYLIYMPAASDALFDGDRDALNRALRGMPAEQHAQHGQRGGRGAPGEAAALTDLGPVLVAAEQAMGPLSGLSIQNPGRSDARIEVRPVLGNRIELTKGQSMLFDGVSGQVLRAPAQSRPSLLTQRVMSGMHFAQFGGYPMRWLYFLCGLASCAMIATGLVLFTVKRRRRHEGEGALGALLYHVAERLNVSVVAGLSIACIGLLWANRLLPVELAQRGGWEVRVFFLVWLATLGHAIARPWLSAWREQLGLAALLCLLLPMLNFFTVNRGAFVHLELTCVVIGALLGWCCWKLAQPAKERPARRGAAGVAEVN